MIRRPAVQGGARRAAGMAARRARAAQANGFGWAHWDYNQGFGLLDEAGRPDAALTMCCCRHEARWKNTLDDRPVESLSRRRQAMAGAILALAIKGGGAC